MPRNGVVNILRNEMVSLNRNQVVSMTGISRVSPGDYFTDILISKNSNHAFCLFWGTPEVSAALL